MVFTYLASLTNKLLRLDRMSFLTIRDIERVIPKTKVLAVTANFLEECGWRLEIEDQMVNLPNDLELYVQSRAFVKADGPDVFLGNHYEAVVYLGYEEDEDNVIPQYGILKMYFNQAGEFVSEDRHSRF
jgi:hypothetical protein